MSGRPVDYTEKERKKLKKRVADLEALVEELVARIEALEGA